MKLFLRPNQQSCQQFYGNSMVLRALLFPTQAPTRQSSPIAPLKRMIMQAGDPKTSVVPILENSVQEGNQIEHVLQSKLRCISMRGYELSAEDFADQLELTSRFRGIEQVEMFFDAIPNNLRGYKVYCALLSSYAHHRCLGKAEATMQKLCELGFLRNALPYNIMLSLYYEMREVGYADDMEFLAEDMREEGINKDETTYRMLLKVYGENLLIEKMEELVDELDADPLVNAAWHYYFRGISTMSEEEDNLDDVYHIMIRFLSANEDMDRNTVTEI